MNGEGVCWETRNDERREQGRGAGDGKDRQAGLGEGPNQRKAGIGEERGAGIGNPRNGLSGSNSRDDFLGPGALVDIVGPERDVDAAAAAAGTIGYEVLTNLGHRFHRVYLGA